MKKLILLLLLFTTPLYAADTKTTALVELTTVVDADILYIVDDPGVTPLSKKITVLNLFDTIDTSLKLLTILTNETGTGFAVFATSPTFTTSIVLGAADMSEADLEKLDGITNGTAAANKCLVADASIDIDLGTGDFDCTNLVVDGTTNIIGATTLGTAATVAGNLSLFDAGTLTIYEDGDNFNITLACISGEAVGLLTGGLDISAALGVTGIVVLGDGGDNFSIASDGIDIDTSGNITNAGTIASGVITVTGVINTSVGIDAVGAVDLDYGSGDVTDHTFDYNGTGTAGFVLKAGAIDGTEILDDTITEPDLNATNTPGAGEDNYVLTYNHAGTNFTWAADATGGNTAWDDIGDPDNSGLTTITFDNAELSLLTGDNDAAASFFTIQNTDADHTVGNLYLLDLDYSADDGDVDADYIRCQDSGGVVLSIQQDGDLTSAGTVQGGSITDGTATLTSGAYTGLAGIVSTGAMDFGGATSVEIPNGTDPDVDAVGEMSNDTDGGNETGDVSFRGYDGANQFLITRKLKTLNFTLIAPSDIAAKDFIPIWHNNTGMIFTVVEWKGWSNIDDVLLEIEVATGTNYTARTLVDAVTIATNGTGVFYGSDATITAGTIAADSTLAIDFGATAPEYVQMAITGWFNSDID